MRKYRLFFLISAIAIFSLLAGLNIVRPTAAQGSTATSAATESAATTAATTAAPTATLTATPTSQQTEAATQAVTEAATTEETSLPTATFTPTATIVLEPPTPTLTLVPELAQGQIAFREGFSLYLVQPSGRGRRVVANDRQFVYFCPTYSRDGKKIAIIGGGTGYEVYTMDGSGGGQRAVVKKGDLKTDTPAGSTTWSPDAKQIAFTGANGGPFYIVGADGKDLTPVEGASFYNLDWSPDGNSFVAFAADKDGKLGIYSVGIDGQNLKLLVPLPDSDLSYTLNADNYFSRDVVWPRWSPDGKQIAFASAKDGVLTLYIMDADGQNLHRVLPADSAPSYAPSWSSTGEYLTFESDRGVDRGIYIAKTTGEELRLVTSVLTGGCPSWQFKASQ
jgi:Tol biopolymer transport system component